MLAIKLGGSLILNSSLQINSQIFSLISKLKKENIPAVISVGGGKICRIFQASMKQNGIVNENAADEIGIASVNFNAEYLKLLFDNSADCFPLIINSEELLESALNSRGQYKFFISGAWEKKQSSDAVSVKLAHKFGLKNIIRMSDVDSVYDSDPDVNSDARKLKNLTWNQYLEIVRAEEWKSGGNFPVDPIAANLARSYKISLSFTTLEEFLGKQNFEPDSFTGTFIN